MLDPKRILDAEAKNVAFVCRMCTRWYEGEDQGLADVEGDTMCASTGKCGSPIGGKSFEEYNGPLAGYLTHYCYLCGKQHPEKALEPKVPGAQKIGCCDHCFENEVKQLAVRQKGRKIIFATAEKLGPEKFEATQ
jgi:hypothetical protein